MKALAFLVISAGILVGTMSVASAQQATTTAPAAVPTTEAVGGSMLTPEQVENLNSMVDQMQSSMNDMVQAARDAALQIGTNSKTVVLTTNDLAAIAIGSSTCWAAAVWRLSPARCSAESERTGWSRGRGRCSSSRSKRPGRARNQDGPRSTGARPCEAGAYPFGSAAAPANRRERWFVIAPKVITVDKITPFSRHCRTGSVIRWCQIQRQDGGSPTWSASRG